MPHHCLSLAQRILGQIFVGQMQDTPDAMQSARAPPHPWRQSEPPNVAPWSLISERRVELRASRRSLMSERIGLVLGKGQRVPRVRAVTIDAETLNLRLRCRHHRCRGAGTEHRARPSI